MVSTKEIRNKIISIQNTKKVTQAMEMVAASKMRKSQNQIIANRPYVDSICRIINQITTSNLEYKHPYMEERDVKCVGYLIISTDRGLCGNLNNNLFKKLLSDMKIWSNKDIQINLAIIGSKGVSLFHSMKVNNANVVAQTTGVEENISLLKILSPLKVMLQAYGKKYLDRLYVVSNKFINRISQIPTITQLIPFVRKGKNFNHKSLYYLYEPDSKVILDTLMHRYIECQVYQSVIENIASEHAARMIAMRSATDNSNNLIKKLQSEYNKVRQANITQELTEIISGGSAV